MTPEELNALADRVERLEGQSERMTVGDWAAAIRANIYRAEPNAPSYPVDVVETIILQILGAGRREGLMQASMLAKDRAEKAIVRPFDTEQGDTPENRKWHQAWNQSSHNALHCAANAIAALASENSNAE